jgi:hypothetical protein
MDSAIVGLIGVVVGAAISTGATYLLAVRKEADERKRKRAEKFEELVSAVYEYDHWTDTVRVIRVVGSEGEITVSPFAKIHAISDTYFPDFEKAVEELRIAGHTYGMWMLEVAQNKPQKDALMGRACDSCETICGETRCAPDRATKFRSGRVSIICFPKDR